MAHRTVSAQTQELDLGASHSEHIYHHVEERHQRYRAALGAYCPTNFFNGLPTTKLENEYSLLTSIP